MRTPRRDAEEDLAFHARALDESEVLHVALRHHLRPDEQRFALEYLEWSNFSRLRSRRLVSSGKYPARPRECTFELWIVLSPESPTRWTLATTFMAYFCPAIGPARRRTNSTTPDLRGGLGLSLSLHGPLWPRCVAVWCEILHTARGARAPRPMVQTYCVQQRDVSRGAFL